MKGEESLFSVGEGHSVSEAKELWSPPVRVLPAPHADPAPPRLVWLAAQHEGLPWGLLDLEAAVPKG